MLFVLGFSHKDADRATDLLSWIAELDATQPYPALLVASHHVQNETIKLMHDRAAQTFSKVTVIRQSEPAEHGWPLNANALFRCASDWVKQQNAGPWAWLEPDAVPLQPGWLTTLESEYRKHEKPFMGTVHEHPFKHFNGVMIYPQNISQYNPYMLNGSKLPWDCVRPEITMRFGHNTHLIQRMLADPMNNIPMSFPNRQALEHIRPGVILFHGVKDGSLINLLRRGSNHTPQASTAPKQGLVRRLNVKIRGLISGASAYVHAGNLGDIVYALYAIKAAGGGDLFICPVQRQRAICTVPVNKEQFEMFAPLLRVQPYLRKIEFRQDYPTFGIRDLNFFRNKWIDTLQRKRDGIETLCKCHFLELGLVHKFNDDEPWLSVPNPLPTGKIIVHRSPRYNAPATGPQSFPWQHFIKRYAKDMLFVGLESEHEKFQNDFRCKLSYWRVKDFLELARLIAGARGVIANQSFPLSVAIGCGQKVIVEALPRSPDCAFHRSTYWDQLMTDVTQVEL